MVAAVYMGTRFITAHYLCLKDLLADTFINRSRLLPKPFQNVCNGALTYLDTIEILDQCRQPIVGKILAGRQIDYQCLDARSITTRTVDINRKAAMIAMTTGAYFFTGNMIGNDIAGTWNVN